MSKVVPDGWKTIEVQDAFVLGRGRVISKPEIQDNRGIYPVYSSQSKNNGKMGSINTYDFDGEYITWTTDGAYAGTVFHRTGKFNCTNVCGTLKKKNSYEVDLRYVSKYLSTVAKNYVSYVGNPKLMNGVFAEIPFLLPPLPEQQKIASILTSVDEVIEKTRSQINKLQDLKKGTMNELLTRGIGHTEFKDSPVGRIPVGWEVISLSEIISIKHGYAFEGEHFTATPNEYILLTPGNFHRDGYLYFGQNTKYFTGEIPEDYVLANGDLLIVMTDLTKEMTILGNTIILSSPLSVLHNQRIGKIDILNKSLDKTYLNVVMNSYYVKEFIKITATGTTVRHTAPSKVLDICIPIPSLREQQRIVSILSSMDTNIEEKQQKLQQTQSLKKSLMQDLLTGKVRVTVH